MFYEGFEFGRRLNFELTGYALETVYRYATMYASRSVSPEFMDGFKALMDMRAGYDTEEARIAHEKGLRIV